MKQKLGYSAKELEIIKKEDAKVISEKEAPGLAHLGVKAGDTMKMDKSRGSGTTLGN